jgi:2'-hydroxyisoflavone reductase
MKVLVIGGTVFVGRSAVEAALDRGDEVTLFNRGLHDPGLFPEVQKLRGDRRSDLSALEGSSWDVVIDTCAFQPEDATGVSGVLSGSVERYVFVSSASVYRDWPAEPVDEDSRVWRPGDGDNEYGIGKAQCEAIFEAAMPGRVVHARAGVIVGPYENIGRLPYWLRRMADFDDVIAPGAPDRPFQVVDARDLANWMWSAAEAGEAGTFNVAGAPGQSSFGDLIDAAASATGSSANVEWIDDGFLLERGVEPWSELPLWLPDDKENAHGFDLPIDRAVDTGLKLRSLARTIAETWAWLLANQPVEASDSDRGRHPSVLDRAKEEQLLKEWRALP